MNLTDIKKRASAEIADATNAKALEKIRIQYLGRKGELTKVLRSLSNKPLSERKKIGEQANALKDELEKLFAKQLKKLQAPRPNSQKLDITLPGKKIKSGHLHPLTLAEQKIEDIFHGLNFSIVTGPEIETEYYNFDALNIPLDHPAREMWDTFWLQESVNSKLRNLLRTHTSPAQIHYMREHQPPFQIIVPGRVFRYEATDSSHEINFYQFEGLMVGKDISLSNFKYIATEFFQKFFPSTSSGQTTEVRFRPSYFPFTEPSVEVDVKWNGKWLEVMGAGMVHPKVLTAGGYNPKHWQGFAFGGGVDRLAMIKYGIDDIRLFYNGDLRFIHQF